MKDMKEWGGKQPEGPMAVTSGRQNRRQWIEGLTRHAMLGSVVTVVTYLASRRLKSGCSESASTCRSCRWLSRCSLPASQSAKGTASS
ncbi:MAG: hypothetical protein ACQESR_13035 [Planctomycetota bacterium]